MSAASARNTALSFAMVQAALIIASPLAAQAPPGPRFEVASLKERDLSMPGTGMQRMPGRLVNRCATLTSLVYYAFRRTLSTPVEGLPGWASAPCGDARTADTYEFQATMPVETTDADIRLMLQAFLTDRFRLAVHWETRTLPVLALVVAPGGFKAKATDPKDDPPRAPLGCPRQDPGCHFIWMGSASMTELAGMLGSSVGRPVVDKTGLRETYYFGDIKWAGETAPDSPLPSLPAALREQFGLQLKSDTGPVEVLVIDRAERPRPN